METKITWKEIETTIKWVVFFTIIILGVILLRHFIFHPEIPFEL